MNEQEFSFLTKHAFKQNIISVDDLENKSDRTLIYGYTCDRDSWHVYLKDAQIITVVYTISYNNPPSGYSNNECTYDHNGNPCMYSYNIIDVECNASFIPDKRIHPNACDFEFCKLILENGGHLPFTGVAVDGVETKQYYGLVI